MSTPPHYEAVDGCTGKSRFCWDPTRTCTLHNPNQFRPALDALVEWDEAHPDATWLRVAQWNVLGLARSLPAAGSDRFETATMAHSEITFGPPFGQHPRRLRQRFWITDTAVIIGTAIDDQAENIHTLVPVSCRTPATDVDDASRPVRLLRSPISRPQAERMLASGSPLTSSIISAIRGAKPEHTVTTSCSPRACDPSSDQGCVYRATMATRSAGYGLDGWDAWQQTDGPTGFDVHDWTDGQPLKVGASVAPDGSISAYEAECVIDAAATALEHVTQLRRTYWLLPNLAIITTSTDRHRLAIHTITPQRPRANWLVA